HEHPIVEPDAGALEGKALVQQVDHPPDVLLGHLAHGGDSFADRRTMRTEPATWSPEPAAVRRPNGARSPAPRWAAAPWAARRPSASCRRRPGRTARVPAAAPRRRAPPG